MRSTTVKAGVLASLLTLTLAACGSNAEDVADAPAAAASEAVNEATTEPKVLAEIPALKGVSTAVTLDPEFLSGVTSLGLTPGLVGATTLEGAVLTFPITGGAVTLYEQGTTGDKPFIEGVIEHEGNGLTLTGGGKVVELKNFDVDAGESELRTDISVDGAEFGKDVETFFLDGSTLTYPPTMEGTNAILEGTTVSLTKGAADALNKVFGTTALTEFFPVGVAKITAATS